MSAGSSGELPSKAQSRFPGNCVEVVFAADDRYAMQLGVAIKSLVRTFATSRVLPRSQFDRLSIHVVDYGISAENRERLTACIQCHPSKPVTLRLTTPDIRADMMETFTALQAFTARVYRRENYVTPPAMYATFLIQDFLPDLSRVIFLDADLLVLSDIRELWAIDSAGSPVSAVPDYNDDLLGEDSALSWPLRFGVRLCLRDQMRFQVTSSNTTFNTGVLMLELDLIRQREPDLAQGLLRKARELMAAHEGEPVFFSDQDMISAYLGERINLLPAEWNFHDFVPRLLLSYRDYRRAMTRAKIMHYNGPPRPWEPAGRWRPFRRTWYKYLDQTPWAHWRPALRHARLPRSRGSLLRTAVGGLILVGARFRNHFFTEQDAPETGR